ncbi:hypothetical protein L798_14380 [Zootermopsis nevadensis]|uniref:Uncharacterized protein n=1 Tax=Zootermopsis nevadensis TaxID=136037 RepID=A0A067QZX7_ZOONE|nr:hypothetical protein L798_14380 [Zootermopsis nevadensis]
MNFYSGYLNAEVIDDTIFAIGGQSDKGIAYFDAKDCQWHQMADMNFSKTYPSTCVIKNLPNASDYEYKHRENQ